MIRGDLFFCDAKRNAVMRAARVTHPLFVLRIVLLRKHVGQGLKFRVVLDGVKRLDPPSDDGSQGKPLDRTGRRTVLDVMAFGYGLGLPCPLGDSGSPCSRSS